MPQPKYTKELEELIHDPNTVSLNVRNDAITQEFLDQYPFVRLGKRIHDYAIIYFNRSNLSKVASNFENYVYNIYPFVLGLLDTQNLESAGIIRVQNQPYLSLAGQGVLLGFVDTGIDYNNKAFIYENNTTKIQYIWDQTIRGDAPYDYPYGTEYNKQQINEALRSEDPYRIVPHRDTVGHGTFLASVACGRKTDENIGAAPDSEIIVVKLRGAYRHDRERHLIPDWQENAFSSDDFIMGIQYIVDRAADLKRPVAICVALGSNFGSHDSFSVVEEYLSEIAGTRGVVICVAAGNESQAGHHTQGQLLATGESQNIEFRASDKHEDINLTIWNYALDRLSVSVTSPTGEKIARVPAKFGIAYEGDLVLEKSKVIIDYAFPIQRSGEQLSRIRILDATPGIWTVTVYGDVVLSGVYDAWLPMTGFIDPETTFLSPKPNCTITIPATAMGVISCGAYDISNNSLATTSSWGPTRLPTIAPDLVAPGVNVGGMFPNGYGTMSGTSVSAAITAGASALLLQWGIIEKNDTSLDSFRVRAELIGGCERNSDILYPNNQWGYGKLNLLNTFRFLRPI